MSEDFDTERMCRLNGKQPTMRDRWTAFYRLYRISQRHGVFQDMASVDCFRVLFRDWAWIRLVSDHVPTISRATWPKFLRREFIKNERKRRLHGDHPEWAERDKEVAARLRSERGMEVTPDEVATVRRKVIDKAREKAVEFGIKLPADDDEVLRLLKPEK